MSEEKYPIDALLKEISLAVSRQDRGFLANLRAGLNFHTEARAWPVIARYCSNFLDETDRRIWLVVGGLSAMLGSKDVRERVSIGRVLRQVLYASGNQNESLIKNYESKFRRVLNCHDALELCDVVIDVVRAAEQKGVEVNTRQLFWDLRDWRDEEKRDAVKLRWARDFYHVTDSEQTSFSNKDVESEVS